MLMRRRASLGLTLNQLIPLRDKPAVDGYVGVDFMDNISR